MIGRLSKDTDVCSCSFHPSLIVTIHVWRYPKCLELKRDTRIGAAGEEPGGDIGKL